MRSGEGKKSLAASIVLFAAMLACLSPIALHAASKAKPEIPLGEETYDAPSETQKKSTTAPQLTERAHGGSQSKETTPAPTPEASEKGTDTPSTSSTGSNHSDHQVKRPAENDEKDALNENSTTEKQGTLLEGKVPPATPAKGAGFVWFGAIFVILAIAIFIFT